MKTKIQTIVLSSVLLAGLSSGALAARPGSETVPTVGCTDGGYPAALVSCDISGTNAIQIIEGTQDLFDLDGSGNNQYLDMNHKNADRTRESLLSKLEGAKTALCALGKSAKKNGQLFDKAIDKLDGTFDSDGNLVRTGYITKVLEVAAKSGGPIPSSSVDPLTDPAEAAVVCILAQ